MIDPGAFWHLGASLALHPDGTRLASTQGTVLQVWDAQSAQVLLESEEKTVLQSLAYAPDGRLIAGGCGDATIRLWDAATGKIQKTLADEDQLTPVTALAFAPHSKTLASAGATGMEVWLWNVDSGEPCLLIPDALGGCAIVISTVAAAFNCAMYAVFALAMRRCLMTSTIFGLTCSKVSCTSNPS